MSVIPENQRIAELRRLGASEALVRLSSGELLHEVFRGSCLGPPYFVYHEASVPDGPPLVPLWDHDNHVVGVWQRTAGLEFIEYSIEAAHKYTPLARTEQGFWATQFDFLYECDIPLEKLREAAAAVGYRFVDRHFFDSHQAWLREFVADIDGEQL